LQNILYNAIDNLDKSLTLRDHRRRINDIFDDYFEPLVIIKEGVTVNLCGIVPEAELSEKRSIKFKRGKYDVPTLEDLEIEWIEFLCCRNKSIF
jgi:hypothetical protein